MPPINCDPPFLLSSLPPELLDHILEYLSAADLHHLARAYRVFSPAVHNHLHRLLFSLTPATADDLLAFLASKRDPTQLRIVLSHLSPVPPAAPPQRLHDWQYFLVSAKDDIPDYRRARALLSYVSRFNDEELSALAGQLGSVRQASVVAAKTGGGECLRLLLQHPGRASFYNVLCVAVTQVLGITRPLNKNWRVTTRDQVAVEYFASGCVLPAAGFVEETQGQGVMLEQVLAMPGLPLAVKRVLICLGDASWPGVVEKSVFTACSVTAPDCPRAAAVLRLLLRTLREDDGQFPEMAITSMASGFVVALQRACSDRSLQHYSAFRKASAKKMRKMELRVVEAWLEECGDVLLERVATRKWKKKPAWREMLNIGYPHAIWSLFFTEDVQEELREVLRHLYDD